MLRHLMTGLTAAALVIAAAGCSATTSTTSRFGYAGPPPLFSYQDGYIEDKSATGPIPTWSFDPNVPGSRRYSRFAGLPRSGTRFRGLPGRLASRDPWGLQASPDFRGPWDLPVLRELLA